MSIEKQLQQLSLAISYVVQNMDGFSDFQALQVASIYPEWHVGVDYRAGQVVRCQGQLYRCVQGHLSQADWAPDVVASLWTVISYTDGVEDWKQPTGQHDAYNVGDHVMHEGEEYVSRINDNTTVPGTDNRYWERA